MERTPIAGYFEDSDERTHPQPAWRIQRVRGSRLGVLTVAATWARRRFVLFTVLVFVAVAVLTVLDGVSAARHFHVGVAVCGALIVILVAAWFAVAQRRTG